MHPGRGLAGTASDDRTARIWDLATGALRHVLRPLAAGSEVGRLYGAAVHPTQPLVAVAGTSGIAATAHLNIRKLVWSADGTVLLAGYSGDPASTPANSHGVRAFALDGRELLDDSLPGPVFGLAVAAGGQAATVGLGDAAKLPRGQRRRQRCQQHADQWPPPGWRQLQPRRQPLGRRLRHPA